MPAMHFLCKGDAQNLQCTKSNCLAILSVEFIVKFLQFQPEVQPKSLIADVSTIVL